MTLYDSVIIVVSCLFAVSFISAILLHYKNRRRLSLIESLTDAYNDKSDELKHQQNEFDSTNGIQEGWKIDALELIAELQIQKDLLAHTVIKLQGERYQLLHRDIHGRRKSGLIS